MRHAIFTCEKTYVQVIFMYRFYRKSCAQILVLLNPNPAPMPCDSKIIVHYHEVQLIKACVHDRIFMAGTLINAWITNNTMQIN